MGHIISKEKSAPKRIFSHHARYFITLQNAIVINILLHYYFGMNTHPPATIGTWRVLISDSEWSGMEYI